MLEISKYLFIYQLLKWIIFTFKNVSLLKIRYAVFKINSYISKLIKKGFFQLKVVFIFKKFQDLPSTHFLTAKTRIEKKTYK